MQGWTLKHSLFVAAILGAALVLTFVSVLAAQLFLAIVLMIHLLANFEEYWL